MATLWDKLCDWDAALQARLLGLLRSRRTPRWLVGGLALLPVLLLLLALGECGRAVGAFRDAAVARTLPDRAARLSGAARSGRPTAWKPALDTMAQTRGRLRRAYPGEVRDTDDAWGAFSGSLLTTGRVDGNVVRWMRDAGEGLAARIESRAQTAALLSAGVLALSLSLGITGGLLRRPRVRGEREEGTEENPQDGHSASLTDAERGQYEEALEKTAGEVLHRSRQVVAALDGLTEGFCALDDGCRVVLTNPAAERALGKTRCELLDRIPWEVCPALGESAFADHCRRALSEQTPAEFEVHDAARDVWLRVSAYPSGLGLSLRLTDISEAVLARQRLEDHAVVLAAKTAELEMQNADFEQQNAALAAQNVKLTQAHKALAALSTVDGLTTLKNHRAFQELLGVEVQRAARYGTPLSLLLLDLDHFRRYNEAGGHTAGDAALKRVAQLLKEAVRETDVVARFGGEQFALLLPQTEVSGALILAERVRAGVAALELPHGLLSASLGVCGADRHRADPAALLACVTGAVARAKAEGRDRVVAGCAAASPALIRAA